MFQRAKMWTWTLSLGSSVPWSPSMRRLWLPLLLNLVSQIVLSTKVERDLMFVRILTRYKNISCFYTTYSQFDVCAGPPELSHRRNMSDTSQTGAVHRTDSPDNDSAFSDSVSLLSSESSASSGRTDTHSHSQVIIVLLVLLYLVFCVRFIERTHLGCFHLQFHNSLLSVI